MKKDIFLPLSIASLVGGYFLHNFAQNINDLYGILSMVATALVFLSLFSFSTKGRQFWSFFKEVKEDSKKIYFPKLKETFEGLGVVVLFCSISLLIIWFYDGIFATLYHTLM